MDALDPETNSSNSSLIAGIAANHTADLKATPVLDDDCTPLHRVDLMDMFAKMDVGSIEFWGSASLVWMMGFVTYCVLFYAALFGVFFYWGYVYHRIKHLFSSRFLRSRLLCLLTLQIFWFVFSFAHGILVINSVASSGADNGAVAVATRIVETITSLNFVSIIIATPFFSLWLPLIRIVLFNLIIYLLTMAIIVISIVGGSGTLIVVMIVLRSLLFIASVAVIFVILLILHFKSKICIYIVKRQERGLSLIYILIAILYFLISYSYFLYTLSIIANNSNCLENVQLHRAVWLVLNFLLRICEVSFFMLEATAFIITICTRTVSRNLKTNSTKCTHLHVNHDTSKVPNFGSYSRETKESTTYQIPTKSVTSAEEDIFDARDSEKRQIQQIEQVQNNSKKIEFEQLYHTPNVTATLDKRNCEVHTQNVEYTQSSQSMSCQSAIPNQLNGVFVDPDRVSDAANITDNSDTLSNIHDGKAITTYMHVSSIHTLAIHVYT